MDFIDKINELSAKVLREKEHISTEEATKAAWIMPFINALGYNVFDPLEVIPEFTADVGIKKGEKVDYCIQKDGQPIILIECKYQNSDLNVEHASQLFRYFVVSKVRFAILTNGIIYKFYTDLETPNTMDSKPFFEFNMLDIKEQSVDELKKFSKTSFDLDQILTTASDLKYTREIKRILQEQMANPSDDFVKLLISDVYTSIKTQTVVNQFAEIVKRAFQMLVNERISDRLKSALADNEIVSQEAETITTLIPGNSNNGIETTEEEHEAYLTIKAILREVIDVNRIFMRDAVTYCAINLDDNNRKTFCRLRFNSSNKSIGIAGDDKQEVKITINDLSDIYNYAEELKKSVKSFDK